MAKKLDKLAAVNIVLSNIGQAPVSVLDNNDNPMVVMASNIIEPYMRDAVGNNID